MSPITARLKPGGNAARRKPAAINERSAWPAVEEYLRRDNRVIVPIGSQEQHGRHLPLGTDWMIPFALGQRVARETGVFCTSPVCFGMSWLHSGFPGTIAVRPTTLISVYTDIIDALVAQGFGRIMILNGHGGNGNALNAALSEVVRRMGSLRIKVHEWWRTPPVEDICVRDFACLESHAGPAETSVMLHLFKDAVDMEAATDHSSELLPFFPNPKLIRELCPDGVMQTPATRGNAATGAEIVAASVAFLAAEINVGGPRGEW